MKKLLAFPLFLVFSGFLFVTQASDTGPKHHSHRARPSSSCTKGCKEQLKLCKLGQAQCLQQYDSCLVACANEKSARDFATRQPKFRTPKLPKPAKEHHHKTKEHHHHSSSGGTHHHHTTTHHPPSTRTETHPPKH